MYINIYIYTWTHSCPIRAARSKVSERTGSNKTTESATSFQSFSFGARRRRLQKHHHHWLQPCRHVQIGMNDSNMAKSDCFVELIAIVPICPRGHRPDGSTGSFMTARQLRGESQLFESEVEDVFVKSSLKISPSIFINVVIFGATLAVLNRFTLRCCQVYRDQQALAQATWEQQFYRKQR